MGNRISKHVIPRDEDLYLESEENQSKEFYVRDASGNIMAVYRKSYNTQALKSIPPASHDQVAVLALQENNIYGSQRVGVHRDYRSKAFSFGTTVVTDPNTGAAFYAGEDYTGGVIEYQVEDVLTRTNKKSYEFTNHLGNVLATSSDRKKVLESNDELAEYISQVLSQQDYYPFGMVMPGRSYTAEDYRYGFNGMQRDDEIKGSGTSYTAKFWQYDSRLGRRWNIDPVIKPDISSYATFGNNPVLYIDPNGDDWFTGSGGGDLIWHEATGNKGDVVSLKGREGEWTNVGSQLVPKSATGGSTAGSAALIAYAAMSSNPNFSTTAQINKMGKLVDVGTSNDNYLSGVTSESKQTNYRDFFLMDDEFHAENFFSLIVGSFSQGIGHENYLFSENSNVSAELAGSFMTFQALTAWHTGERADGRFSVGRSPLSADDLNTEWVVEPERNGYTFSVSHTLGSADYYIYSQDDGSVWIEVVNSTNVASATGANANFDVMGWKPLGPNTGYKRPLNSGSQPWTNVSQTIFMILSPQQITRILNSF